MATFFIALLGAAIGMVAGFFAGAVIGSIIAAATHMSNFEGAAGYFAVLLCGPIGALPGLVAGVWLALRAHGGPRDAAAVARYSVSSVIAIVAGSAAVVMLMLYFDSTLNRGSSQPQVLFEIRMPPGTSLAADRSGVEIELNTDRNSASAYLARDQHDDGDRPVISGGVELAFRTSSRIVVLKRKGEPDLLFKLKLSGRPGHSDDFGPWQPIDWVADPAAHELRPATAADKYEIRYRVRDPDVEYGRPMVAFELSLPSATPLPDDPASISVEAREGQNDMDGAISAGLTRRENDRVILQGTVQLAGETHSLIAIGVPNQPTRLFEIKLPPLNWILEAIRHATSSPDRDVRTYGPWDDVSFIRDAGRSDMRAAGPGDDAKLRYMLE